MMIKTKLFYGHYDVSGPRKVLIDIDEEMNEFLAQKQDIELIDIIYSVHVAEGQPWNNALMIYKEK